MARRSRSVDARSWMAAAETRRRGLTARERQVLTLLARGYSGEEVARELGVSGETVRAHVRNSVTKLRARTRLHAVVLALQRGEITPEQQHDEGDREGHLADPEGDAEVGGAGKLGDPDGERRRRPTRMPRSIGAGRRTSAAPPERACSGGGADGRRAAGRRLRRLIAPASSALTSSVTPAAGSWRSSSRSASLRPPSVAQRALAVLGGELPQGRSAAGAHAPLGEVRAVAVRVDRVRQLLDPARRRHRGDGEHRHLGRTDRRQRLREVAARARAASPRSAFVTTSRSGTSMIPAFRNCSTSPDAGWTTTATVSHTSSTSVSDWPTPTVSTTTRSNAGASASAASRVAAASPPSRPPAAVERISTPSSRGSCSMRARSPSSEPPERLRGRVDGQDGDGLLALAPLRHEYRQQRGLARPGRAGYPHDVGCGLASERGGGDLAQQRSGRVSVRRGSRSRSARRARPSGRPRAACAAQLCRGLRQRYRTHAAATTPWWAATRSTMSPMMRLTSKSFGV